MVRTQPDPPCQANPGGKVKRRGDEGGIAQLGEHLLCKQGVVGSIPSASTKPFASALPKRRQSERKSIDKPAPGV